MTDRITVGVVADLRREEYAWDLSNAVDADFVCYDDGTMGCTRNHLRVWTKIQQRGGDWGVVIEDDAMPVDGFSDQLRGVLAHSPADVVGLYLGTGYPKSWQRFIRKAITEGKQPDANYILSTHVLHGVGIAVRHHLIGDMLRFLGHMTPQQQDWPVDEQITAWCRLRGQRVAYCLPSILDHRDGESLVRHPDGEGRESPRHAWQVGCRDMWRGDKTVAMP